MLYYEAKGRLVLLTRALVLVQLRIEASGKVIPVMKMKVAVAGTQKHPLTRLVG